MSSLEIEKLMSQLTESNRKMDIFRKVSFELNKLISLPRKLNTILSILDEQFGLRNTIIWIPDHDKQVLTVFASHGYKGSIIGQGVPFGQGLVGLAAVRKRNINLTGIRRKYKRHFPINHHSLLKVHLMQIHTLRFYNLQILPPHEKNNYRHRGTITYTYCI